MEEQLSPSTPAPTAIPPNMTNITPEALEQMKARAREDAIRTTMVQRQAPGSFQTQPQVVYVRRNLTVAELILTVFLACGIVLGVQASWNLATKFLPRIEIKIK